MGPKKWKRLRRVEVWTGLLLVLIAFSYILSLLLDFTFVSPYASLQEDLNYLAEQNQNQRTSAIMWGITGIATAIAIPFYVFLFRKRPPVLHLVNALFLSAASAGFILMALRGFDLYRSIEGLLEEGFDQIDEMTRLSLLETYRDEQLFRRAASSLLGIWALVTGISRIWHPGIPFASAFLMVPAGPVLVYFNWYDPDHLVRTIAMATLIIAVLLLAARMIYRGLEPDREIS